MKKIFMFSLLAIMFAGCAEPTNQPTNQPELAENYSSVVYICTGGYATKYHSTSRCSGFGNCKGDIEAISESQAISSGRTPCKKCY